MKKVSMVLAVVVLLCVGVAIWYLGKSRFVSYDGGDSEAGKMLVAAAMKRDEQLLDTIVKDARLDPLHLVVVYMYAANKGDKLLSDRLLAELHRRENEGMPDYLLDMGIGLALQEAARQGHTAIVDGLIAHERMMPIDVGLALLAAADGRQEALFGQLAQDSRVQPFYRSMVQWIAPELAERMP